MKKEKERFRGAEAIPDLLGIQPGEKVLILSDRRISGEPLQILADAITRSGGRPTVNRDLPLHFVDELPAPFENMIRRSDVILFAASQSFYHTSVRKLAKKKWGKRVAECYGIVKESLTEGGLTADPSQVTEQGKKLCMILRDARLIRISTPAGTDLTFALKRAGYEGGCYRAPGTGGNLPAGEVFLIPVPKSAKGRVCFDLSMDVVGPLHESPLEVEILDGMIRKVSGTKASVFQVEIKRDERVGQLSEVGFGTNAWAKLGRTVLEDEKAYGTCHIGFGNSTYFGGENGGPHYDGIFTNPIVTLDGGRKTLALHRGTKRTALSLLLPRDDSE